MFQFRTPSSSVYVNDGPQTLGEFATYEVSPWGVHSSVICIAELSHTFQTPANKPVYFRGTSTTSSKTKYLDQEQVYDNDHFPDKKLGACFSLIDASQTIYHYE
jgi:hypothetical protein